MLNKLNILQIPYGGLGHSTPSAWNSKVGDLLSFSN